MNIRNNINIYISLVSLVFVLLFSVDAEAHSNNKVLENYNSPSTIVQVPLQAVTIHYSGVSYQFYNGVYYCPEGDGFIVVKPPIGMQVEVLPRGTQAIVVKGHKYYCYHNIFYMKYRGKYTPNYGMYSIIEEAVNLLLSLYSFSQHLLLFNFPPSI